MVKRYKYDGGGMSETGCGDYVTVCDYSALEEKLNAFMRDVDDGLDAFIIDHTSSADGDLVTAMQAAFTAVDNPQRE